WGELHHHRVRVGTDVHQLVSAASELLLAKVARLLRGDDDPSGRQPLKLEVPFAVRENRALRTAGDSDERVANGLASDGIDDRATQRKAGVALGRSRWSYLRCRTSAQDGPQDQTQTQTEDKPQQGPFRAQQRRPGEVPVRAAVCRRLLFTRHNRLSMAQPHLG